MPLLTSDAVHLLTIQENVIATWQVTHPAGRQMRRAHKQGVWRQITKRTYAAGSADPTVEQKMWAAALHAGPYGLLTGEYALRAHGWTEAPRGAMHVVHPGSDRDSPHTWLVLHRLQNGLPRASRTGVPRVRPARAILDACATAENVRRVAVITLSCLQQGLTTPQNLMEELDRLPNLKRRGKVRELVEEFDNGITSTSELDFAQICRRYRLREPDRQVPRYDSHGRLRRIDVYWDAESVHVEIDGFDHIKPGRWMDDHTRQNSLVVQGHRIFLRVSSWALRYEPELFMIDLARALGTRLVVE